MFFFIVFFIYIVSQLKILQFPIYSKTWTRDLQSAINFHSFSVQRWLFGTSKQSARL